MATMKRAVVAVLVAACVLGFSSDGLARRGVAHRSGAGVVRNPTVLLASPAPQVPALKNRIPAPLPPSAQPPVINGPRLRSPYGGVM
jgi:hypothetical protein